MLMSLGIPFLIVGPDTGTSTCLLRTTVDSVNGTLSRARRIMIGCFQSWNLIRSSAELQPVYSLVIGLFSTFKEGIVMQTSVLTRVLFIRQRFCSLFSLDIGFCVRPYRSRHAMDKPYVCETDGCGKSYYQRSHLQRHVKEKHQIVDVDDTLKTSVKIDWCVALTDHQCGE